MCETEDEVYYFDKTHIKKNLGIKDVYVITRVLSGEKEIIIRFGKFVEWDSLKTIL